MSDEVCPSRFVRQLCGTAANFGAAARSEGNHFKDDVAHGAGHFPGGKIGAGGEGGAR